MALLGLDIGTSGCKATIIDLQGMARSQAHAEYALSQPQPGWQELDPDRVWHAACQVIRQALDGYQGDAVRAIGVSSFGEAAIPVGPFGEVLHPAMIYIDPRGSDEVRQLSGKVGQDRLMHITGTAPHAMYSIGKIMWLVRHRPEVAARVWKYMLFADFILYRLGGAPHMDYSLAARTMAFDITGKAWSEEILDAAGLSCDVWPEPVQAGTPVGTIRRDLASQLGLPPDTLLVAGGHDQACAALGAGVIGTNLAVDGLGSTECVTPSFDQPVLGRAMTDHGFACVPHVVSGRYVTYAFTFTCGSLLKWYLGSIGRDLAAEAARQGVNPYTWLISQAADKPAGLFVLPHFAGAATPYMDASSSGAVIGMTLQTDEAELVRGILEGITFEIMTSLDRLRQAGVVVDELRVVGGLARSDTYLQLKADMMGKRLSTLRISEAGTLGVAILAGTAAGIYGSIDEAVRSLVQVNEVFEPHAEAAAFYQERFHTYQRIYPAVRAIWEIPERV